MWISPKIELFICEKSCKRVLFQSCGQSFPPGFPAFFKKSCRIVMFVIVAVLVRVIWVYIYFYCFMSQLLSYSTRISEYCVLKSGVVYLQATLFHSKLKKCFFFSIPSFLL